MENKNKGNEIEPKKERIGVYICHCGGNISDHVDVETLKQRVEKIPGVVVARTNMFMCSDPGQELIMEDIKNGVVDRVVVASCAPSLHESTFRNVLQRAGANPYLYEHANIREQVSWVCEGEAATTKASRLVAAAVAKAKSLKPLEPLRVDATPRAVVIGGGIAGLRAAEDLAARGFEVVLVERSPFLGGRAAMLEKAAPEGEKVSDLMEELAGGVLNNPAINIYTCTRVIDFAGYVGNFTLKLRKAPPESNEDRERLARFTASERRTENFVPFVGMYPHNVPDKEEEFSIEAGVIVLATGFRPYTPRPGEYGYGQFEQVITLAHFIQQMAVDKQQAATFEINGRHVRSIAMIHCVGSRQIPGIHEPDESGHLNEYCSRTCCSATLYAANQIRERFPGTRVYEFYRDIRTYGRGQEELYNQASSNGVVFLRFEPEEPPIVEQNAANQNYPLLVKVKDTLTFSEEVEVPADLVVLAVGMEPNPIPELVGMMKLPIGEDRFLLEVHPKLRPVELSVSGILLAGTCQAPMDIGEASSGASAAAVKASGLLARGYVELDPFVAEVDLSKCKGTGACVGACLSEGALNLVEMEVDGRKVKRAQVFPAMCLGCGACVAVCPENAINIKGWTLQQYEDMVDMIVADELTA